MVGKEFLNLNKKTIYVKLSEKYFNLANEKNIVLSAEVLPGNLVCVYGRRSNQDEEDEQVEIFANDEKLTENTKKFIEKL